MKKSTFIIILFLNIGMYAQNTNINISNGVVFDAEPFMALNPVNHNNIVIAWMSYYKFEITIKIRSSFNNGKTWSKPVTMPHHGVTFHSADVSMVFDKSGMLYLLFIDYTQSPDSGGVYITHSKDGGLTWSVANRVWSVNETTKRALDRPWLALDNMGTLYVTTKPAPWIPAPNRPYLKYSIDSGKIWSSYRFVDTIGYLVGNTIPAPMATLAVSNNGRLNMAYPSYLVSQSLYPQFFLATTYDKGNHITYNTIHTGAIGVGDTLYKAGYRLCCNPNDSNKMVFAFPGKVYSDADIFVFNTIDGGKTWNTTPVRVNDDSINNGKWQDMVWVSYDSTGRMWVTWRDRRLNSGSGFINQGVDIYGAISNDNGTTFSKNIRLTDTTATYDSILKKSGNDFMCNAIYGDTAYTVWSDTHNGRLNVYFVKTGLSTSLSVNQIISSETIAQSINFTITPDYKDSKIIIESTMPATNGQVNVYDVTGKQIVQNTLYRFNPRTFIPMPIVTQGIYIVEIVAGIEHETKKIYWGK